MASSSDNPRSRATAFGIEHFRELDARAEEYMESFWAGEDTVQPFILSRIIPGTDLISEPATAQRNRGARDSDGTDHGESSSDSEHSYLLAENEDDYLHIEEERRMVEWLNGLGGHITEFQHPKTPTFCPHMKIPPTRHQLTGLARVEYAVDSPFKGVLVGDPPGRGRTLVAMMAIVKALPTAERFSVVVVPASLLVRWQEGFGKFFEDGCVDVFILSDQATPLTELLKHNVVLTTYDFCLKQASRADDYFATLAQFNNPRENNPPLLPTRPNLSIFSGSLFNSKYKSPYLVLDEAHLVNNSESATYWAIKRLRETADACIMLTGSPIDSTWEDTFALSTLLKNQPFKKISTFQRFFSEPDAASQGKRKSPTSYLFARLLRFLSAWMFRRSASIIRLPNPKEITLPFALNDEESAESEHEFARFLGASGDDEGGDGGIGSENSVPSQWGALCRAGQHTFHQKLVEIVEFLQNTAEHSEQVPSVTNEAFSSSEEEQGWSTWRLTLEKDGAWRSSRILALIFALNKQRDLDPAHKTLILAESVYFLDIVQVALSAMDDPVDCLHISGRLSSEEKSAVIHQFNTDPAYNVMLISRGAGGLGLDPTAATVVVVCGASCKQTWDEKIIKRAVHFGQLRPVTVIRLVAENCSSENYHVKIRARRHRHNKKVLQWLVDPVVFAEIA